MKTLADLEAEHIASARALLLGYTTYVLDNLAALDTLEVYAPVGDEPDPGVLTVRGEGEFAHQFHIGARWRRSFPSPEELFALDTHDPHVRLREVGCSGRSAWFTFSVLRAERWVPIDPRDPEAEPFGIPTVNAWFLRKNLLARFLEGATKMLRGAEAGHAAKTQQESARRKEADQRFVLAMFRAKQVLECGD